MRALAKEPEVRYQSCRELLEDLRNYRALTPAAGNPDATLISPRSGSAFPLGIAGGSPQLTPSGNPNVTPAIRSLQNRGTNPMQTPVVRRTGTIAPIVEEPKKSSPVLTIILALILVGVIAYGFNKLRPEFQAARELNSRPRQESPASVTPTVQKPAPSDTDPSVNPAPTTNEQPNSPSAVPAPVSAPSQAPVKSDPVPTPVSVVEKKSDPPAARPEPKKAEPTITAAAAEYKGQIEAALADRSMSSRVKVSATSNTIMLTGKLRPAEHSSLLHFMRNAPASVHVVDEISYDDTPLPTSQNSDNSGHPIPSNGNAAVHVLTNVIGAKATLFGPSGRPLQLQRPRPGPLQFASSKRRLSTGPDRS